MALAQGTSLLLLDEPTTFLDLAHQVDVLDLVERLHHDAGRTVVLVLHDLNLAARYASRLIAMRNGRIVAQGTQSEVLTEDMLRDVFELDAQVVTDPVAATPLVIPIGRRHRRTPATPIATTRHTNQPLPIDHRQEESESATARGRGVRHRRRASTELPAARASGPA